MKRALVASVLGIVASLATVASSRGQGQMFFDNYGSTPYYPVMYNSDASQLPAGYGALAGHGVGGTFKVELWYALGNNNVAGLVDSGISVFVNPTLTAPPGGVGAPETGYFQGPIITVPGYVSGPVTFRFEAWETAGPTDGATYATSNSRGQLTWTEPSIPSAGNPAGFFTALPGPTLIIPIPEPCTGTLAGIGTIALFVIRYQSRKC